MAAAALVACAVPPTGNAALDDATANYDRAAADAAVAHSAPLELRKAQHQLARFMKEHAQRTVAIEGYTDSVGADARNQALSEKRAIAVKSRLPDRGIEGHRVTARGMGEAGPVASNDTAAGRQRNRRVRCWWLHERAAAKPVMSENWRWPEAVHPAGSSRLPQARTCRPLGDQAKAVCGCACRSGAMV